MLSLVLAVTLAQSVDPDIEEFVRPYRSERVPRASGRSGRGYAYFEAFPATGAGTFGVCSTTAPTGAKGEALTFTRTGSATCTRTASGGMATTGIANGDLVTLPSNVSRVEYDSAGVLGLRVESSRTNVALQSESFDNAAWVLYNAGATNPVVTANAAIAPDGTLTADRIDIPAVSSAGQASGIYQNSLTVNGQSATASVYIKGVSGSGTVAVFATDGTPLTTLCNYVSTSWTRCTHTSLKGAGAATDQGIAVAVVAGSTGAQPAQSIYVWGWQSERNTTYATSYIPTATATVTRNAETAYFAPTWPTSASISMASTFYGPTPASGSAATALEFNGLASILNESGGLWRWFTAGTGQSVAITSSAGGVRTYGWHDGTDRGVGWGANTAQTTSASAANKFGATLYVGGSAGNRPDAIISRICVDPVATRCR